MTGNIISSKVCIARVFDRFNIDYSGFIPRVPDWIFSALREIDAVQALLDTKVAGTVAEYKCALPSRMQELVAVEYEGFRLPNIEQINTKYADNIPSLIHNYEKYERNGNYIITTFEEGDIVFYIKTLPLEFDDTLRVYFPLIEDNEDLLVALDWYILKRLLERGHNIAGYSLKENNEFTNPALAFEKAKKIARNSVLHIGSEMRYYINKQITSFLSNNDYYHSVEFNNMNNE